MQFPNCGYNVKTPSTPGHIFKVIYTPGQNGSPGTAVFKNIDGKNNGFGDIPANSIVVTNGGTIYIGTDYGVVVKHGNSPVWTLPAAGLPNINVPELLYVPERNVIYAVTHGQGIWQLKVN